MLEVRNLKVQYGNLTIVDNVSFSVGEGQWLMIVGPNGAGKHHNKCSIPRRTVYRRSAV